MKTVGTQWLRIGSVIAAYSVLIYLGQLASDWALDYLEMDLRPSKQATIHKIVVGTVALYVLLLVLPFMPGIEIGLGLIAMLGRDICFLVYLSTVIALVLAYAIGRLVPTKAIVAVFNWLGLTRARDFVRQIAPMHTDERLAFLLSHVPARFLSFLLRHRYLALAVILNVPGNAFIGGGGGIAIAAGMSRVFNFPTFLITIALAVSPFPLIYYFAAGAP